MHTYHPIDLQNWERREIYEHFSRLRTPHYAVAATIDVTQLLEYKRQHRLSFYLSLIYLATQAQNGLEAFRMRIRDGKPVVYDRIHTNFTHKRPDEQVFHFYTAPFEGSLHEYVVATSLAIAEQTTLFAGMAPLQNVVYYSCAPTLDATAITNPGLDSADDAIPRINWGRYQQRDGRWQLNVTVTVNHRFVDGYHIGLFFQRLQALIDALG